jgi:phenylacetate-CoA ligase
MAVEHALWTLLSSGRHARMTREELSAYRDRSLRRIVRHAYENVSYYRDLFDRAGISAADIRTAGDLALIPMTEKRDLKAELPERITARGLDPDKLTVRKTTGSTGELFTVLKSRSDEFLFHVFRLHVMRDFGLKPSDRMALISTRTSKDFPASWRAIQRMDVYGQDRIHVAEPPDRIARVLLDRKPDVVTGDSAVLDRVAMEIAGIRGRYRPRFVVTGSEMLTPFMKRRIGEGFGAAVRDTYCSEEVSVIAWECGETGLYHVREDNVIVEVMKDGVPVKEGERGEVIVTALHFRARPFLRYRQGDEVTRGPDVCPCGKPFPTLKEISGRAIDYLRLPGGRELFASALAIIVYKHAPWIERYEIVQEREDLVVLRAVPSVPPRPEELGTLKDLSSDRLGAGVEFRIELVQDIRPGPGGKFRIFRTKLGSPYDRGSHQTTELPPGSRPTIAPPV